MLLFSLMSSLVAQLVKNRPAKWETWIRSLGWEDPLEEGMETHSSVLAWKIPWTEEPGGLQSTGSQRVGQDWATKSFTTFISGLLNLRLLFLFLLSLSSLFQPLLHLSRSFQLCPAQPPRRAHWLCWDKQRGLKIKWLCTRARQVGQEVNRSPSLGPALGFFRNASPLLLTASAIKQKVREDRTASPLSTVQLLAFTSPILKMHFGILLFSSSFSC